VPATGFDGVKNGDETDSDCGGSVAPPCQALEACKADADCESGSCKDSACTPHGLLLATLNNAHHGDLGGLEGADALCAQEAAEAGLTGEFKAFLTASGRQLKSLHSGVEGKLPVYNLQGQILFEKWNSIFSWYGHAFPEEYFLYSFDGKMVVEGTGAEPDWADADAWTGTKNGGSSTYKNCSNWNMMAGTGTATDLDEHYLFKTETKLCIKYLAVICVGNWPH